MSKYLEMPWGIEDSIENLKEVGEHIGNFLLKTNYEGKGVSDSKEFKVDFERAIEALEKQVPKKLSYLGKNGIYDDYDCSACGQMLRNKNFRFCPKCGQRLDWSDKE